MINYFRYNLKFDIIILKEGQKMTPHLNTFLILCPLIFISGFIDSIAGGGGLISLPAYILAGLPIHMAYGTNKLSSTFGTFISAIRFIKNKQIHFMSAVISALGAIFGSFIGARISLLLEDKYLKYSLIVLLPIIAVFIISRRSFGEKDTVSKLSSSKIVLYSIMSGLLIGCYDGFFGPGTGTFLILIYTGLMGFNLTTASGNAKFVNLASNVSALVTFIVGGSVMFSIGVPAIIFSVLGNWVGSGLAIKNGAKVIKPVFLCVLALLFITLILNMTIV
jgi:uncharacterized protein